MSMETIKKRKWCDSDPDEYLVRLEWDTVFDPETFEVIEYDCDEDGCYPRSRMVTRDEVEFYGLQEYLGDEDDYDENGVILPR